jgi:hypothetical protein
MKKSEHSEEQLNSIIEALDDLIIRTQEKRKALLESKEKEEAFIKRLTEEE